MKLQRLLLGLGLLLCIAILASLAIRAIPDPAGEIEPFDSLFEGIIREDEYPQSKEYVLGDLASIPIVQNSTSDRTWIEASLVAQSDDLVIWLEDGLVVEQEAFDHILSVFEESSLPVLAAVYPDETSSLASEERFNIVIAQYSGSSGYFSSWVTTDAPSNAVYVSVVLNIAAEPGNDTFDSVLVHEMGHYLQWLADDDEDTWVSEGFSTLIEDLCGYTTSQRATIAYGLPSDTQLNTWGSQNSASHYAISFAFFRFLHDRYGIEAITDIAHSPANGLEGILDGLAAAGFEIDEQDLMADWALAGVAATAGMPEYGYADMEPHVVPYPLSSASDSYAQETAEYATDYYLIDTRTPITLTFSGETTTSLMPQPPMETRVWWSDNGDRQTTWLELELDLTDMQTANLSYDLWYELEERWDWAYALVSTPDDKEWIPLQTANIAQENQENGWFGYTGMSGSAEDEGKWVEEIVNLDAYCGQVIHLRIQCESDDAINLGGIALCDVRLNDVSVASGGAEARSVWRTHGFKHVWPTVTQDYVVQIISPEAKSVERLELTEGETQIALSPEQGESVILAITPLARWTIYPAEYSLDLEYLD